MLDYGVMECVGTRPLRLSPQSFAGVLEGGSSDGVLLAHACLRLDWHFVTCPQLWVSLTSSGSLVAGAVLLVEGDDEPYEQLLGCAEW